MEGSKAGNQDVLAVIGEGHGSRAKRWLTRGIVLLLLGGIVGGFLLWRQEKNRAKPVGYVSTPALTDDLRAAVTATGSVKALDQVDVGVEVSGIVRLYQSTRTREREIRKRS